MLYCSTGITEKVSYFKSINVGAVWLSPIFLSPQNDFGYDISDYKEIDPLYGTMEDFERMRDEFHKHGTRTNIHIYKYYTSRRSGSFRRHNCAVQQYAIILLFFRLRVGIKLLLDFVPNHTSDEHEWFQKSIKKIAPFTEYYVWKDPIIDKYGNKTPPNNWVSVKRS